MGYSTGYVDEQGKYHQGGSKAMGHDVNPTYKEWSHDLQRKEFGAEIIQPRRNGKPNPDFVKTYLRTEPDVVKQYFTEEQIKQAEREL